MRGDPQPVPMGLVDDRRVHPGRHLLVAAAAIVDPDLDQVDLEGRQLPHGGAPFLRARDPVRQRRAARLRPGDAPPGRAKARRAGNGLRAHVEGRAGGVPAEAHRHAHAVVRLAPQVLDERLALAAQVHVRVDERRDDRAAAQVDARRAGRDLHLARAAHGLEARAADDEGGVGDGLAAVADDQPRPFVHRHIGLGGRRRRRLRRREHHERCRCRTVSHPEHPHLPRTVQVLYCVMNTPEIQPFPE